MAGQHIFHYRTVRSILTRVARKPISTRKLTVRYGNMAQAALLHAIAVRTAIGTDGTTFQRARPSAVPAPARWFRKRPDLPDNELLGTRIVPCALWLLRLTVGAVFLQHVMRMAFSYEPADTSQLFGLPPGVSPFALAW